MKAAFPGHSAWKWLHCWPLFAPPPITLQEPPQSFIFVQLWMPEYGMLCAQVFPPVLVSEHLVLLDAHLVSQTLSQLCAGKHPGKHKF